MFERLEKILNNNEINAIQNLNILIIGIGGVGGYALETLVRMGVKNITIADYDIVDITNLNRQIIATNNTIGKYKVDVAKERALSINPNININIIKDNINKDNYLDLFENSYSYVIDACDTITTKVLLIEYCTLNNIKIISCMGTGNRLDPTKLEITDIWKTNNDPLAKVMRKLLKERNIKEKVPVICSKELPIKIGDRTPGSTSLVPSVAGIYISSYIINKTLGE
ncbi:MAG: ThiF family adenylyltransferase [Bacilli bacterium]